MNAHTGILIIAALHTGDYIYGFFLAVAILIWLAATVLYIDKKMRERRWRKRDARRGGYLKVVPKSWLSVSTGPKYNESLSPTGRAESSG